jgi:Pectinacetylesterase
MSPSRAWIIVVGIAALSHCSSDEDTVVPPSPLANEAGASSSGRVDASASSSSGSSGTNSSSGAIADGGAPDSTMPADAASDAAPPPVYTGAPIVAPENEWSYVPFPDSQCGNGSTTGIMVNPGPNKKQLVIFLMGGGACWNSITCGVGTASDISEDLTEEKQRSQLTKDKYLFKRDGMSPIRDASYVFIPYCTGDIHSGDNVKEYNLVLGKKTVHHKGRKNLLAFLNRLAPTFKDAERVLFTGASAGGFGTLLTYPLVKAGWPNARVDLLDDSGPPMTPNAGQWGEMKKAWNTQLPAGCINCENDITNVLPYLQSVMGDGKLAFASHTEDQVIRSFLLYASAASFRNDLLRVRQAMLPTQKSFYVAGTDHVLMIQSPIPKTSDGVAYEDWIRDFWNDSPNWKHVGP